MALIVEDGTGLKDADSLISLDDARFMAANYGYTLPEDDDAADAALRQGAIYVDLSEPSFYGSRLNDDQGLSWPRSDAYRCRNGNKIAIAFDDVPSEARRAQVIAAATYGAGENPRGNYTGRITTAEKVGPIEVEYADSSAGGETFVITAANDALKPLKCANSNTLTIRTLRV